MLIRKISVSSSARRRLIPARLWLGVSAALVLIISAGCSTEQQGDPSTRGQFVQFSVGAPENRLHALAWIEDHWQPGFEAMAIEALGFAGDRDSRQQMIELLQRKTGQSFGKDTDAWRRWLWRAGPRPHPRYAEVKAAFYAMVDVNYREYFLDKPDSDIRLDEVQWVGLRRSDELTPLRQPKMLPAQDSTLTDQQWIYGIELNQQARAYARGLVAQHGVINDQIDSRSFMLVNDSLTGSAAAYLLTDSAQKLASSGFLHRGDTLLYDPATQSLWSSLRGRPVVGPLVAENIQLTQLPAVTTQWGEWRRRHPETLVTADDPAKQNYLKGQVNFRKFVAKDRVVDVESTPNLSADSQVLGLTRNNNALAIPLAYLHKNRLYKDQIGRETVTVLTSKLGASRVYLTGRVNIEKWLKNNEVADAKGRVWRVTEQALVNAEGGRLPRLPTRQATWAAWQGAYQSTGVVEK